MKYLKYFKESKEDIHSICRKYRITNYTINEDFTIDVDGSVGLIDYGLTELPLKFGKVSGDFSCSKNKLLSLVGSPKEVVGDFYCQDNKLTSLEGSPEKIGGDFYCQDNKLTSLEGSPEKIGGDFYCYDNQLESLEEISKKIRGSIDCDYNQLRDVKGVPDGWGGTFYVRGNPVYEIFKFFPQERWDEVIEHLNEYNVIRDGKVVIMQALERVFWELDLEVPEIEEIPGYEIQF